MHQHQHANHIAGIRIKRFRIRIVAAPAQLHIAVFCEKKWLALRMCPVGPLLQVGLSFIHPMIRMKMAPKLSAIPSFSSSKGGMSVQSGPDIGMDLTGFKLLFKPVPRPGNIAFSITIFNSPRCRLGVPLPAFSKGEVELSNIKI
jgi:hypothetical protein